MLPESLVTITVCFHVLVAFSPPLFIVLGMVLRKQWMGSLAASVLLSIFVANAVFPGNSCPLTTLERHLRGEKSDIALIQDGFIVHYAREWFGITIPSDAIATIITLGGIFGILFFAIRLVIWITGWWMGRLSLIKLHTSIKKSG